LVAPSPRLDCVDQHKRLALPLLLPPKVAASTVAGLPLLPISLESLSVECLSVECLSVESLSVESLSAPLHSLRFSAKVKD
jgi:hypothetical protein